MKGKEGIYLSYEDIINISDKIGKPCYEYLRSEMKKELFSLEGKKDKVNAGNFILLLFSLMSLLNANIFVWLVELLNKCNAINRESIDELKEGFLKNITEILETSIKVEFDEKHETS